MTFTSTSPWENDRDVRSARDDRKFRRNMAGGCIAEAATPEQAEHLHRMLGPDEVRASPAIRSVGDLMPEIDSGGKSVSSRSIAVFSRGGGPVVVLDEPLDLGLQLLDRLGAGLFGQEALQGLVKTLGLAARLGKWIPCDRCHRGAVEPPATIACSSA